MLDGTRFGSPAKAIGTSDGEAPNKLIDSNAHFTSEVNMGDVVMNITTSTSALVANIDSDTLLTLHGDIMSSGHSYEVCESGGTVGGSGHVQRDWLVTSVNGSTAKWKFIVSELPFLHDEDKASDKWADYDPLDALRNYLMSHITAENVIWVGADRHFSALDDGSHPDDPWPSVACANANCSSGSDPTGSWLVNGQIAEWSADDGALGGFVLMKVGSDQVQIESYNPDGSLMNNGIMDLTMTVPSSM
jgi:hypothetical protein